MSKLVDLTFEGTPINFDLRAYLKGKRVVHGYGNPGAPVWFIGEAPGKDEDEKLIPFIGYSGKELEKMVRHAGGNLNDLYRDNVVPIRPPGNKLDLLDVPATVFYPLLEEKISKFRPKVVVALGETALRALCGLGSISKHRGSLLQSTLVPGIRVVPTYHPAYVLRDWTSRTVVIHDIRRALEEAEHAELILPTRTFVVRPSFEHAVDILDTLSHSVRVGLDIETRGKRIACIGLSDSPQWAISVPFELKNHQSYWSEQEEATIWGMIGGILANEKIEKIIQNASFDVSILYFHHAPTNGLIWDTMWVHNLLWPDFEHSLAFMTSIYTCEPYYKDDGKYWEPWMDEANFWTYNCKDVCVMIEIFEALYEELKQKKLLDFYTRHYQRLQVPLLRTQLRGFRIHEAKRIKMKKLWGAKLIQAQADFNQLVGKEVNVFSPKQVPDLLYGELKLPVQRDPVSRRPTTGENALEGLLIKVSDKHKAQVLKGILNIRGIRKFISSYLNVTIDPDLRIRASFGHTDFGRLKSSKFLDSSGTNLQTIPEEARRFFISD